MSYNQAFDLVVGSEGSQLDLATNDTGNWTGGAVGSGTLKGSKFGVSAASYPNVDIANLKLEDARAIYKKDYWDKVRGDDLAPQLAYVVFDAAVNNGVGRAVQWLQSAVGASPDGVIGPMTLALANKIDALQAINKFMAKRIYFMGCLSLWKDEPGWSVRLAAIPFNSLQMTKV